MFVWSVVMVTTPVSAVSVAASAVLFEPPGFSHTLLAAWSVSLTSPAACSDHRPSAQPSVGTVEQASSVIRDIWVSECPSWINEQED